MIYRNFLRKTVFECVRRRLMLRVKLGRCKVGFDIHHHRVNLLLFLVFPILYSAASSPRSPRLPHPLISGSHAPSRLICYSPFPLFLSAVFPFASSITVTCVCGSSRVFTPTSCLSGRSLQPPPRDTRCLPCPPPLSPPSTFYSSSSLLHMHNNNFPALIHKRHASDDEANLPFSGN